MKLRWSLIIVLLIIPIYKTLAQSGYEQDYLQREGDSKAFAHLKCIRESLSDKVFQVKRTKSSMKSRCNSFTDSSREITAERIDKAVIVDYTKTSDKRRFYIIDFENDKTRVYFTSHGRFGETSRSNTTVTQTSNSVKEIRHFSNISGSNASSSGLHITGHSYIGKWKGPDLKKRSLVLHGIESGINDNSCARATVIHGNSYIRESGSTKGVRKMSSGCPMLDYNHVNSLINQIRGQGGHLAENVHEPRVGGAFYFVYGPREAKLPADFYCKPENLTTILKGR